MPLPDDHLARHRFTPSKELRLTQDRRPAASFPALLSALALRLHPGRTVDAADLVAHLLPAWLADPDDDVGRIVRCSCGLLAPATTTATTTTLAFAVALTLNRGVLSFVVSSRIGLAQGFFNVDLCGFDVTGLALIARRGGVLCAPSPAPTATPPPTTPGLVLLAVRRLTVVVARNIRDFLEPGSGESIGGRLLGRHLRRWLFGRHLCRWLLGGDLCGRLLGRHLCRWPLGGDLCGRLLGGHLRGWLLRRWLQLCRKLLRGRQLC
jgi:hypothetical protein